jgi:hypothetical protein
MRREPSARVMQVTAFSTRARPDWRWRIVGHTGQVVEESSETFPTIAIAIAHGTRRLESISCIRRAARVPTHGSLLRLPRRSQGDWN